MEPNTGLSLIEGVLCVTKGSETCSPGLWKLLTEGEDWRGAVRLIAINDTLRAQVPGTLEYLKALSRPADPEWIIAELARQAPAFGLAARRPEEWATLFGVYLDEIGTLSEEAIADAFHRWHHNELYPNDPGRHGFMPKPNEINALAKKVVNDNANARFRARQALRHQEKPKPHEPSPEDRARVRAMLAEFKAAPKPMPGFHGKPKMSQHEMAERIRAQASAGIEESI